jgi:hypothetical protein
MTPRRERRLQVEAMPLQSLMKRIEDEDYTLTREETSQMLAINELAVVLFLKSWTLTNEDGTPRKLPESEDDVLDLERPLYDALTKDAAKLFVAIADNPFSVDAVEDENSPTVA